MKCVIDKKILSLLHSDNFDILKSYDFFIYIINTNTDKIILNENCNLKSCLYNTNCKYLYFESKNEDIIIYLEKDIIKCYLKNNVIFEYMCYLNIINNSNKEI